MSRTTGPILALGTITVVNATVFNDQEMDWRVPVATGLALVGFNLAEKAFPDGAHMVAWTALLATLVTRIEPGTPSPVESAVEWWKNGSRPSAGGGSGPSREV
ncbi:hypothetical protein ACFW34_35150 [Streptomyces sp. NPDC058848]|uniref:hypothetical protein n=1 Tax=Streptomyces sp. NPDC058848 TaxID=3346650 RepID=UPI0036CA9609